MQYLPFMTTIFFTFTRLLTLGKRNSALFTFAGTAVGNGLIVAVGEEVGVGVEVAVIFGFEIAWMLCDEAFPT